MISWLGRDPLDDSDVRDGLPDTLLRGADVRFPRLFAFEGGLPGGFATAWRRCWCGWTATASATTSRRTSTSRWAGELDPARRAGLLFAGSPEWV